MRHPTHTALLSLVLAASQASCVGDDGAGETRVFMMSRLNMVLAVDEQGTAGLDLDGESSHESDEGHCAHDDHIGTDGIEGVDNQLARLGDVIELFEFGDVNSNLQQFVNEGGIAVLVEVSGVDDLARDSRVTVRMHSTNGPVDIGTDGVAEPWQSFDLQPGAPYLEGVGRIEEGVLTFELDGSLTLPLRFAMTSGDVRVQGVQGRLMLDRETGSVRGTLGGYVPAVDVETLVAQALEDGGGIGAGGNSFLSLLGRVLRGSADEDYDDAFGTCTSLSGAIEVEGVPAFILDGDVR